MEDKGHIYVLIEREFIKTKENIYKIGHTKKEDVKSRTNQYPKGSKLIYSEEVNNPKQKEIDIINLLKTNYTQRMDIGIEYFEGSLDDILLDVISVLRNIKKNVQKPKTNEKKDSEKKRKKTVEAIRDSLFLVPSGEDEMVMSYEDFEEKLDMYDKLSRILDDKSIERTALEECLDYNIFSEYKVLESIIKYNDFETTCNHKDKLFKKARFNILDFIITCVRKDNIHGDYFDTENNEKIINAGKMLWEEGGEKSMRDKLVWSFIPKRYHRDIDILWDGIGSWKG
jgi:hypothetical protein